jgi:hypothetical protein
MFSDFVCLSLQMLLEAEQQIRTDAQAARRADDCFERCC